MTVVAVKKIEIIDGYTIKCHANGKTRWSKGKVENGQPIGYWKWYRVDGTIKRSGHCDAGEPVGEWITYDQYGETLQDHRSGTLKMKICTDDLDRSARNRR